MGNKGIGTKGLSASQVFKIKSNEELLKESIFNILTTKKGERVGNPSFGSHLDKLLFSPNVEEYWEAIKMQVANDIELWEPRVAILDVEFIADVDNSKVTLFVLFLNLITQDVDGLMIEDIQQ